MTKPANQQCAEISINVWTDWHGSICLNGLVCIVWQTYSLVGG